MIKFDFVFAVIALLSIFSALNVVISKNPLHSILFLILVFFNLALLLLLQQIEFLALVVLIIYIGAIAVLFLFVIYMLNIKLIQVNEQNWTYLIGVFYSVFILFCIYLFIKFDEILFVLSTMLNESIIYEQVSYTQNWDAILFDLNNLKMLGLSLYVTNHIIFIFVGVLLLIAMLGSIWLTAQKTFFLKEQALFEQIRRYT